jgi:hypothetical protein
MGDYTIKFKLKIMPNKLEKLKKLKGRRDKAYSKAMDKSMEQGADSPFDMGVGTETRAYKKSERLTGKLDKKFKKYKENKKGPFAGSTSRGSKRNA